MVFRIFLNWIHHGLIFITTFMPGTPKGLINLDPNDPLWAGSEKPYEDHPTGVTHRGTLKMGDWKLHRNDSRRARNVVVERKLETIPVPQFRLFNLAEDPQENTNVITDHPEVAERLKAQLDCCLRQHFIQ